MADVCIDSGPNVMSSNLSLRGMNAWMRQGMQGAGNRTSKWLWHIRPVLMSQSMVVYACGTCPFTLVWLQMIADFGVTFFPYILLYERPIGNPNVLKHF